MQRPDPVSLINPDETSSSASSNAEKTLSYNVTIGDFQNPEEPWDAYAPNSSSSPGFWDNASRQDMEAAYGADWDAQHNQRPDTRGSIVIAGRETFGNLVFQQPLTTLATAGVQEAALIGAVYAGGAAAPVIVSNISAAATTTGNAARATYVTTMVFFGTPQGQNAINQGMGFIESRYGPPGYSPNYGGFAAAVLDLYSNINPGD